MFQSPQLMPPMAASPMPPERRPPTICAKGRDHPAKPGIKRGKYGRIPLHTGHTHLVSLHWQ